MLLLAALIAAATAAPHTTAPTLFRQLNNPMMATEQLRLFAEAKRQNAATGHFILCEVNAELLAGGAAAIVVNPTSSVAVEFARTRVAVRGEADATWVGDSASGYAVFVVNGEDVVGSIHHDGYFFQLRSLGDGMHVVMLMDSSAFPPELEPLEDNSAAISALAASTAADTQQTTITVIVAYTPAAQREVANIVATVQLAVDETQEGYFRSNVSLNIVLTRSYLTQYTESASFSTDLTRFRTKNDGYMDEVHTYRNQDRANIAHLVRSSASSCGVASTIMATTTSAFCLTAVECATGYYTFGHEMGHLQGARHDPETDGSTSPYAYGHGYIIRSAFYRSIMAYNIDGETRVLQWSNPDVDYLSYPTGATACCDNARVLDTTAATAASWCASGC